MRRIEVDLSHLGIGTVKVDGVDVANYLADLNAEAETLADALRDLATQVEAREKEELEFGDQLDSINAKIEAGVAQ